MHLPPENQFFAFVWGSRNVSHTVVDLARRTYSSAIFDLSPIQFTQMAAALRMAGATAAKISANDFMEPEIEVFLEESGVKTLWIEYHPDLFSGTPEAFLERLGQLSARCACVPVTGDLDLLHRIIQGPGPLTDCGPQRQRGGRLCGWRNHRRPVLQLERDGEGAWPKFGPGHLGGSSHP